MAEKALQQLQEVGSKLESPPSAKDTLIKLLKQATTCLSELDQSPSPPVLESLKPFFNVIVKPELLKHQDKEVRLLVATCACEITRITAPEAPYSDDVLRDIFQLIVSTFSGLSDTNGPSFGRRVVILETLARYRSCVVLLDLECDELIYEIFNTFFAVARIDHPENVLSSMQTIMVVLLEESEEISEDLLLILLSVLGRNKNDASMTARRLAMNVIENSAGKLEPDIKQFLLSSMSGDNKSSNDQIDYHEVIYDIYRCAPQILSGVIPYITGELLTDQLETRLKAVKLVGDLFAMPGSIPEAFKPVFLEFLKRLTDRVVEVRMSVLEQIKNCLLSNPFRAEASQIICKYFDLFYSTLFATARLLNLDQQFPAALCDRLLDFDENVRKQVVAVICDVACHALNSIPVETARLVAERLRDKSLLVKRYALERLAELYKLYCSNSSDESANPNEFDWIPGKILRCCYDKDFRLDTIESVLCLSLFPSEFSVKDMVKCWVRFFSGFEKVEVKALEKILDQKQRLQQEMQRYLSLRSMNQDDAPEIQKKVLYYFKVMSRCFSDPVKAEENFQILDQLKDANIWKILTNLVDPSTTIQIACNSRDDLLTILGEKHPLHEFLSTLSMKCSYLLFSKEHVKEILLEVTAQKASGDSQLIVSCMNILVMVARFCPLLLGGTEESLVSLLKDDNDTIKEGVLHILARAGGTIREKLAELSSSVDLILERLCLEGKRRQAKYAVHALAAITKDDGLKSLSVLYKRLVDMLEEKTHLPAVLQSLGCIAQTAMAVFETRENEIEDFIRKKLLECSNTEEDSAAECWDDRSELSLLKIFGIKTLVKSYLPAKDAHLRLGIDGLLGILRNMLSFGEISQDIISSSVDKAHLKLASAKAVLRLSKHWDHKIPVDIFHLTLRTSEISFPQARKQFLSKVHQYVKDRLLDAKYACAFLFGMVGTPGSEIEEEKNNLREIIQMCQQAKARHLSLHSDASPTMTYPEHMLAYWIHALAHHSSCPDIDNCKDVRAYETIYRQLYFFLNMLVHGDEESKSDVSTNKEKECVSSIISVLHNIKCSEDVVDASKSKNAHAICDLALAVIKRLSQNQKQDNLQVLASSPSLPQMLYKPFEKKEGDDSAVREAQTWLAEESILAHFESLKIDTNGNVEMAEDELLKDGEGDGNEVPLGKIIKHLKSKGSKVKSTTKKKPLSSEKEGNFDILEMVREINLDNRDVSNKFESSNGHNAEAKYDKKGKKRKRQSASQTMSAPVPKRRRSSFKNSLPRSSSKSSVKASDNNIHKTEVSFSQANESDEEEQTGSKDRVLSKKSAVASKESDLLLSSFRNKTNSLSKHKVKGSDQGSKIKPRSAGKVDDHESDVLAGSDDINYVSNNKSSTPVKKRKRRSIAGLAKGTTKEDGSDAINLINCRIKVWWPLDKQFYEGVVQSYDARKKKHVVREDAVLVLMYITAFSCPNLLTCIAPSVLISQGLMLLLFNLLLKISYDDGDVEVLNLEKEHWELIDDDHMSIKKFSSNDNSSKEISPEQKNTSPDSLQFNGKSAKIAKRKRTPKKNVKRGQKGISKSKPDTDASETGTGGRSNVLKFEPAAASEIDERESGTSEPEQNERMDERVTDFYNSDKEENLQPEECLIDSVGNPSPTGKSIEKVDTENSEKGSRSEPRKDQMVDEEEHDNSKEKQYEEANEKSQKKDAGTDPEVYQTFIEGEHDGLQNKQCEEANEKSREDARSDPKVDETLDEGEDDDSQEQSEEANASRGDSEEAAACPEEKADSSGDHLGGAPNSPTGKEKTEKETSHSSDAENSDDEPLSKWKRRAVKAV
ncbi:hypothetical protein RJ641_002494 [Dillenia turbinata]|uniref:Sister chromatid cohesion protein n=1 Tax=Dillenia turbinata TaxID=194707 RepID=A0AAN8VF20_9MAGN